MLHNSSQIFLCCKNVTYNLLYFGGDFMYKSDEIVKRIVELKNEKNLSYRDLEQLTGITHSTIQRYIEVPGRKLPIENLKKIAKALNVNALYLLGLTEDSTIINHTSTRLEQLRVQHGMNVEELAEKLGITPLEVEKIEVGEATTYNPEIMVKMCQVFNVPYSYFIEEQTPTMNVGYNLNVLRTINQISLTAITEFLSIDKEKYLNYERNNELIPFEVLDQVAMFYNISLFTLLGNELSKRQEDDAYCTEIRMRFIAKEWSKKVGSPDFSKSEIKELMNYASFIKSKR